MKNTLIISSIILLLMISCSFHKGDIILLPNLYEGDVTIYYHLKEGENQEYEDGYRVFKIPSTGVLYTKHVADDYSPSKEQLSYYFTKGDNDRIMISRCSDTKNHEKFCIENEQYLQTTDEFVPSGKKIFYKRTFTVKKNNH